MGILSMLMESIDGGIGPTEGGAAAAAETFPVMAFFDLWLASAVSVQEMATVLFDAVLCRASKTTGGIDRIDLYN